MAHTTIMRWVQCHALEFERRWTRLAKPVGRSCRVDEAYVQVCGQWTYLYRAVDRDGRTVDFRLSAIRTMLGFKAFRNAAVTIAGIEPTHRIRKDQFTLTTLRLKYTSAPAVWNAVLATQ